MPNLPGSISIGMWIAACLGKAELLDASTTSYPVVYFKIIYPIHAQIIDILLNGALKCKIPFTYMYMKHIFSQRDSHSILRLQMFPYVAPN